MVLGCSLAVLQAWGDGAFGASARGRVTPAGHQAAGHQAAGHQAAGHQAAGHQAAARRVARARAVAARATVAGAGTKVVAFAGYTIDVPAGWPVYRLARDPSRCVRYDRNAVYLGQPGADQQCPAHLAGRVATLSLAVAHLTAVQLRQLPARGVAAWDTADHEMGALLPRRALSITATYGAVAD